jgi:methylaspartate mutase epsilon subunit
VKTIAEAHGIPTIGQNVEALRQARESADSADPRPSNVALAWADVIEQEAESLIAAVRGLAPKLGDGMLRAFADGVLDLPHVPHPALWPSSGGDRRHRRVDLGAHRRNADPPAPGRSPHMSPTTPIIGSYHRLISDRMIRRHTSRARQCGQRLPCFLMRYD